MDGVRLNQPFGDVVSWDLIPRIAISEVALAPGSNPLFRSQCAGRSAFEVNGGSFGRRAVELERGGINSKGLNWDVAGNLLHEEGWRVKSPSDVRQIFSKIAFLRAFAGRG
jgi:hypothetical protein